jgi:hypothetical protein
VFYVQCILITTILYAHFHAAYSLASFVKHRYNVEELGVEFPDAYKDLLSKFDNDLDRMRQDIKTCKRLNIFVGTSILLISFSLLVSIVLFFTGGI